LVGVHLWFENVSNPLSRNSFPQTTGLKFALFPDLTYFRHFHLVLMNKNQSLQRELPATSKYNLFNCFTRSRWILKCTNRNRLSHQLVSPHSSLCASTNRSARLFLFNCLEVKQQQLGLEKIHSKSEYPVRLQKIIIDSAQDKPAKSHR
jgi:hypothetical protein